MANVEQFIFRAHGTSLSLAESVAAYCDIHRVTQQDLHNHLQDPRVFTLSEAKVMFGKNITLSHEQAIALVAQLRRVIQNIDTGIPILDQFCRSIVADNIILPRMVVPLVKEEIWRLQKMPSSNKVQPQGVPGVH
jgi:hypothetical protein